jgi:hypothetical protein
MDLNSTSKCFEIKMVPGILDFMESKIKIDQTESEPQLKALPSRP